MPNYNMLTDDAPPVLYDHSAGHLARCQTWSRGPIGLVPHPGQPLVSGGGGHWAEKAESLYGLAVLGPWGCLVGKRVCANNSTPNVLISSPPTEATRGV